jgi:perosamine synthetase
VIYLSRPHINRRQIRAVTRVLKSGQLVQGPEVEAFEAEVGSLIGVTHCVAVNSGTSALHLGMLAGGIGPGDEVIAPSFSFAATANAIELTGASVKFADIRLDDFNLDPDHVESLITPRTRAVLAVHLYGHPAPIDRLERICKKHHLSLIEDAAQALGAKENGRHASAIGKFGALSFYATKNISSGEGGMITTNDADLARRARLLRNQGQEIKYKNEIVGFNNRLSDLHAAIGREQLRNIQSWDSKRQRNAKYLSERLIGVVAPSVRSGSHHAFHQYTIRVSAAQRQELGVHMAERGVQSGVYYPTPIHLLPSFQERRNSDGSAINLPVTVQAANEALSLPVHPQLRARDLQKIVDAVNSFTGAS